MLRKAWERWKVIAHTIGDYQARVILGVLYYLLLGPVGLIRRLLADPLGLRREPRDTFWVSRPPTDTGLDGARRQ